MSMKYLNNLYVNSERVNTENIVFALKKNGPFNVLLDVGCWDGKETLKWSKAANSKINYGIELIDYAAKKANSKGINTFSIRADTEKWPIKNCSIDCIVSNQVVEHLTDLDHYFSEASRVLKSGGILVTSTNNLSSFHNILALLFGWAPFDLSNSSKMQLGIGNPLSLHKSTTDDRGTSWLHKCIYTSKWLSDWQILYGLEYVESYGAGLYPFPAVLGRYIKLYSAFITLVHKKV